MDPISVFVNYAIRFEQGFASGNWAPLAACFGRDAVLEISGGPPFAGRYEGRDAIAAYYARVTRAFDRRFHERDLALVEGPIERDGGVWARWTGAYRVAGAPDLPLAGEFFALTRDGEIARYEERFAEGTWARVAEWLAAHGAKLGPVAAGARARASARTRDPDDKRARLMSAARRLFAQRGFAATTTADYGRGLARAMFAAVPPPGRVPSAEATVRAAFDYVREHGALARLLKLAPDPSDKRAAKRATRSEIVGALARGFELWSAAGVLRPMNAQVAAELVFALVEAALIECFVHGDGSRAEEYLQETVACVSGALAPPAARARARRVRA